MNKCYKVIRQGVQGSSHTTAQTGPSGGKTWDVIWKRKGVLPRLRIFLWKVIQRALPLREILRARTSKGEAGCDNCGYGKETMFHMLFECPFARACWLSSPLAIRSLQLPTEMEECLYGLAQITTDSQWVIATNVMWAIWRSRNDRRYRGAKPEIENFKRYLYSARAEASMAITGNARQGMTSDASLDSQEPGPQQGHTCQVDGSWTHNWNAGTGFLLTWGDALVAYRSASVRACCAIQAEAQALKEAIRYVQEQNIDTCMFYTDCQSLVKWCTALQPPLEADWRAYREAYEIWALLTETRYGCRYRSRSMQAEADILAKQGSRTGESYMGYTYPICVGS